MTSSKFSGAQGSDTLIGGAGLDALLGGSGFDYYFAEILLDSLFDMFPGGGVVTPV